MFTLPEITNFILEYYNPAKPSEFADTRVAYHCSSAGHSDTCYRGGIEGGWSERKCVNSVTEIEKDR